RKLLNAEITENPEKRRPRLVLGQVCRLDQRLVLHIKTSHYHKIQVRLTSATRLFFHHQKDPRWLILILWLSINLIFQKFSWIQMLSIYFLVLTCFSPPNDNNPNVFLADSTTK